MFSQNQICYLLLKCCYAALYVIFYRLQFAINNLFAIYCKFAINNMVVQVIDFKEKERIEKIITFFHKVLTCVRVESFRKMAFFLSILSIIDFKGFLFLSSNSASFWAR